VHVGHQRDVHALGVELLACGRDAVRTAPNSEKKTASACSPGDAIDVWHRRRYARILREFFASPMPWTVSRTMSAPASLHLRICSTDAWTSFVSVVPMVWSTMGSLLPILTWPTLTVDVARLSGALSSAQ
tara:strand:+ start:156 stop:545 length:390 start_codon:yes stop_codon:yes gene_type:complete